MTIKNRILSALCNNGSASRAELAKSLGLSSSHISEAANELIAKGIITEVGYRPAKSSRGRKNTLLDLDPSYKFALGIGYAKNVLSIGLTTVKGDLLGKEVTFVEPGITKDELLAVALAGTMRILRDCCLSLSSLVGIGLCVKRSCASSVYGDVTPDFIVDDVKSFSGQAVVYESADEYLQLDERIAAIRPEELYIFGAAKVIRDLLIYGDV